MKPVNTASYIYWLSRRVFLLSIVILFVCSFVFELLQKETIDHEEELKSSAASLILQQQISHKSSQADREFLFSLSKKLDADVHLVDIKGNMLASSTATKHQLSDKQTIAQLLQSPEAQTFSSYNNENRTVFVRCYFPLSVKNDQFKKMIIIDKTYEIPNPYIGMAYQSLFRSLVISAIITLLIVVSVGLPTQRDLITISKSFTSSSKDIHDYEGIPQLMKILMLQTKFRKRSKSIRKKLRLEIEYWETFFNSIPLGVIIVDDENRIINANQLSFEFFNIEAPKKVKGAFIMQTYKSSELSRLSNDFIHSESTYSEDNLDIFRDAKETNMVVKLVRISLGNRSKGSLIVINDITRLRKLQNVRKEFVSNVSHELKTPITVTMGFLEAMEDCLDDPDQIKYFYNIIKRNTHRINDIIQDLLILSRLEIDEKNQNFGFMEKNIAHTLQNIVDLTSDEITKKNVSLVSGFEDQVIVANHSLVELAVRNLLENAIRYSNKDAPLVTLSLADSENHWIIRVSDNGPGIHPKFQGRIFERFFRMDESRDRNTGGSGLGLAIVKHIAQLHNGKIHLDSSLGKGCTFSLYLPKNLQKS